MLITENILRKIIIQEYEELNKLMSTRQQQQSNTDSELLYLVLSPNKLTALENAYGKVFGNERPNLYNLLNQQQIQKVALELLKDPKANQIIKKYGKNMWAHKTLNGFRASHSENYKNAVAVLDKAIELNS